MTPTVPDAEGLTSFNQTQLFGPGSHTISVDVVEGGCKYGGPDPGTVSLSNSYLSTTVQVTFTN
jgi:hypothetical protein